MLDAIIVSIIVIVLFIAIRYIVKAKARGQKCIGCPNSGTCGKCCHCDNN